jgi:serine/threonine protein kinase
VEAQVDERERGSWSFEPRDTIVPGKHAIACLGDGMRTESWLAWDAARWAPVVVKILRPDHVESGKALASLQREADAHRRLQHPAVQRMLEDGTDSSPPYLVMEYVQGRTLCDVVGELGRLMLVDVVRLGLQVCSVLHYLHQEGLLHMDVKPGNVVVRAGQAVVIDLGFVRPIGWAPSDGSPRGSWRYMAPEQCRGEPAGPSTDLFGLGTMLYEIAAGEPAFGSTEDCFEQLDRRAPPVRLLAPELPSELDELLQSLLEPEMAARPRTAASVLRALDAVMPPDEAHVWPSFARELLVSGEAA